MSDLTGARATYVMLRDAGPKGVHSRDIIASRIPGATNPSERLREVADHVPIRKRSERHGRSPGVRAWLPEFAPADSVPVTPAHGAEGGGDSFATPLAAPLSIEAADEQVGIKEPVAIAKDFTVPGSPWVEIPVSQLEDWAA